MKIIDLGGSSACCLLVAVQPLANNDKEEKGVLLSQMNDNFLLSLTELHRIRVIIKDDWQMMF